MVVDAASVGSLVAEMASLPDSTCGIDQKVVADIAPAVALDVGVLDRADGSRDGGVIGAPGNVGRVVDGQSTDPVHSIETAWDCWCGLPVAAGIDSEIGDVVARWFGFTRPGDGCGSGIEERKVAGAALLELGADGQGTGLSEIFARSLGVFLAQKGLPTYVECQGADAGWLPVPVIEQPVGDVDGLSALSGLQVQPGSPQLSSWCRRQALIFIDGTAWRGDIEQSGSRRFHSIAATGRFKGSATGDHQ